MIGFQQSGVGMPAPIEMRWIFVRPGSGRGIFGGHDGQQYETVLQYRYRTYQESCVPGLGGYGEWSEWKDVQHPSQIAAVEREERK